MLLGIILEGDICRFAFIAYFLCQTGISSVQSTNHIAQFTIHNNQTAPGSSITCTVGNYINIVEVYGFKTSFFDIDQIDLAMIHDACSCEETCDIPYLATTPYTSWTLYVSYKCLGTCAEDTTSSTAAQTSPATITESSTRKTTTAAATNTSTTNTSLSSSVTSTAATTTSAPFSTTNSSIASESSSSTGFRKSTSERNKVSKHTMDENGNELDTIVPIAVCACLFIASVACCIVGYALYRRSGHTGHRCKDTTERKEVGRHSDCDEYAETANAGISDNKQLDPHVPGRPKEDEGYESIKFVERLQDRDYDKKLSHEHENVLSSPLVDLAPSCIHETKHDRQNLTEETTHINKAEHINMYDKDVNYESNCVAHTVEDPCYLHPVAHNNDIQNISRATTRENDQTVHFIIESSIPATPVCISQNEADDSSNLSVLDGDNVQAVPKTGSLDVGSCVPISATACDPAYSGYIKPV